MVSITGSANNSSMVGSRLLMYMVMLTPTRSNRTGKPGQSEDGGVAAGPVGFPRAERRVTWRGGVSLNRAVAQSNHLSVYGGVIGKG